MLERKEDGIETDLLKRKDGHSAEGQVHNQVLPVIPPTHHKPEQVKGATYEALQEKLTDRNTTCLEGELIHPCHCREGWLTHSWGGCSRRFQHKSCSRKREVVSQAHRRKLDS